MQYAMRKEMQAVILALVALVVTIRLIWAIHSWQNGVNAPLLSYAFCVVFPASLAVLLLLMPATRTKEGLLMRFGTVIQLLLILSIPPYALYLALGLPVVFLVIELFVTRIPNPISAPLERLILK